jgi:hypothetical protein
MIRRPFLSRRRRAASASYAPAAASPSAGRRGGWTGHALLVLGTLAVAVTGYSLSQAVANERRDLRRLAGTNMELSTENRALAAELRVRMRLPQLQSWSDGIFGLLPASGEQHIQNPLELARYAMPQGEAPTRPTLALLTRDGAEPAAPRLVSLPAPAPGAPAAPAAPTAAAMPAEASRLAPAEAPAPPQTLHLPPALPSDLLRLVETDAPPRAP